MQYHTTDAATACNVTLNTIRNWCKDYGAFLSPGATGTTGNRTFSGRDLDVLRYIASLRAEGMQKGAIVQRLGETSFAEIDAQPAASSSIGGALDAPVTTVTPPVQAPSPLVALDDLRTQIARLERSIETIKQDRRHAIYQMALGFLTACALFLILIGLAVLYGGFK